LILEQLEGVETQFWLRYFEALAKELRGFVGDEHQVAVCLVLAGFLHDAKVVDGGEKGAPGEVGNGLFGELACWEAEFVDFRDGS
jgi:hypothetical protein